jgi:UDP-N-acetylmuramoylalanine-D-glutamate ligase
MDMLGISRTQTIGIFGDSITGKAIAAFCEKHGIGHKIFNELGSPEEQFSEKEAEEYRLIVRSPSFITSHKWVKLALSTGCRCITELDFASCFWHDKIIAITGTNGKQQPQSSLPTRYNCMGKSQQLVIT